MKFYFIWVPFVIAYYTFYGWMSVRLNADRSVVKIVVLCLLGAVPMWPLVAAHSRRIAVDALFYDFFMILTGTVSIILFSGAKFTLWQWVGCALCIAGLTMVAKT